MITPKFKVGDWIRSRVGHLNGRSFEVTKLYEKRGCTYVEFINDGKTCNWADINCIKLVMEPCKPTTNGPIPIVDDIDESIGVGSVVLHTEFHSRPALVLAKDGDEHWVLQGVESGSHHRWMKKYCELEGSIRRNPYAAYVTSSLSNLIDPPIIEEKLHYNNPEEITMKLDITDHVRVNGADSASMSENTYLSLISSAEAQIKEYKELQAGSEAIKASNAITKAIAELESGVKRLVTLLDAKGE